MVKDSAGETTPLLLPSGAAPSQEQRKLLLDLFVICLGFFLIFIAFSTTQNLLSSLIPGQLANLTLALLYISFLVCSLFISSTTTQLLTPKWTLVAGAFTYAVFIASMLYPTPWALLPAGVLSGLGAGLLWTAQGVYLARLAANYARAKNRPTKSVLGLFNGAFLASMQVCQVVGNGIGAVLLWTGANGDGDGDDAGGNGGDAPATELLFYTFLGVSILALVVLGVLRQQRSERDWARLARLQQRHKLAAKHKGEDSDGDEDDVDVPKHKEVGGERGADVDVKAYKADKAKPANVVADDDDDGDDEDEPRLDLQAVLGKVGQVFRLLADPRMYLLSVILLYLGLEQGFLASDITKNIILPTQGLARVPLVLVCFCVCNALGCFLLGRLSDRLGKMLLVVVGVASHLTFHVFFLYVCWSTDDHESIKQIHPAILYVAAGAYGLGDACFNTFSAVILGVFFLDKTEPAFSCRLVFLSLGFVIVFMLGSFVSLFIKLAVMAGVVLLSGALVLLLHFTVASVNINPADDDDDDVANDDREVRSPSWRSRRAAESV